MSRRNDIEGRRNDCRGTEAAQTLEQIFGLQLLGRYKPWGPDLVTHATVVESANDFRMGDWTPAQVTTPGANEIRSTTDDDVHKLTQTLVNAVGPVDSLTLRNVKPVGSQQWIKLRLSPGGLVYFDVINGVVGTETGATGSVAANVGGGWDVTTVPAAVATASAEYEIYLALDDGDDSGVGSTSDGITLDSAEIDQESILTAPNDPTLAARNLALYGDRYDFTNPTKASQLVVGADVWDGLPGAIASGASWIACDPMAARYTGSNKALFAAFAAQVAAANYTYLLHLGNSATTTQFISMRQDAAPQDLAWTRKNDAGSAKHVRDGVLVAPNRAIIAARSTGTVGSVYRDGVFKNSGDDDVGQCTLNQATVACRRSSGTADFLTGVIREFIIGMSAENAQMLAASNLMRAENLL
jgi:hypothetical protein